jgi:uncharacterized protein with von Willebrand factor type A (vWA) domain
VTVVRSYEAQLLAFGRELRRAELPIGPNEVALGLEALATIDLSEREEVRLALRPVLAKSPDQIQRFEALFERFFVVPNRSPQPESAPPVLATPDAPSLVAWRDRSDGERHTTARYSSAERLAGLDIARADPGELAELRRLAARLARRLATRLARRWRRAEVRGARLDLRRTLRRSLGQGGEPFTLIRRRRRRERARLLFLFDVSGSMELYSRLLLELAYALVRTPAAGRVEAFGFATDLYRLTGLLRGDGVESALRTAQLAMPGRRGGTRIGASLERLLRDHRGILGPQTVTVIASDGWDTGDLALLDHGLRALRQRGGRLLWLNPLAGSPGYQPTSAGIRTALPHLDLFAPAHNLESLWALERELAKGPERR